MKIAIIAAIGKNRVIGNDGKIPWHISDDLKRFKKLTTSHAILMGSFFKRTPKPLPRLEIARKPIDELMFEDFTLIGYEFHEPIKFEVAV